MALVGKKRGLAHSLTQRFGILMTSILGISAFYHDSAAALFVDGNIVAAAQEERFTRQVGQRNSVTW